MFLQLSADVKHTAEAIEQAWVEIFPVLSESGYPCTFLLHPKYLPDNT
ncbi:hypothetical protein [Lutispora sp.]|nr:hypothetical protein [Lutispora sp.]MEA4962348.1 hypothetical protein [Lutispora sp.]